ncbi:MAG: acyltransferase [Deltaproteobacteria bacterium]|nr:acyltransferase [Deltaproteobacteria bacterium]
MSLQPLKNPESKIARLAATVKVTPALIFLFPALLVINLAQMTSVVLIPFSRKRFRRFNRWCANTWWSWCVSLVKLLHGTRVEMTGDQVPAKENAIVVANHQQMPDITFLMFFAREKQRLGDLKWVVKDAIKYVPGVGWGMLFLDCIFVKRDWAKDQASIERVFSKFMEGNIPIWLVSFVEGTRFTPAKREEGRKYAQKRGIALPRNVLLPRTKGFAASVQGLRDHLDAVYDVTIGYKEGVPSLWQYTLGFSRVAHLHVRRYPIEDLPGSSEELADWLFSRNTEKDKLLEEFYKTGSFPEK